MRLGPQGLKKEVVESEIPEVVEEEVVENYSQPSRVGLLIGLGIFIVLALLFIWRTAFFYIKYVRGDLEPPTSFISNVTLDNSIQVPIPDGDISYDLLVTENDPSTGAPADKALITIVEFGDFGCPFCKEASYVGRSVSEHSDAVRFIYRDFPVVDLHPGADKAAEAGECAQDQNRFFDYHDKLFQNQSDLSVDSLKRYAVELGLNSSKFDSCLDSGKYTEEVASDRLDGIQAGVRGTPTFFFNGHLIEGAIPKDIFDALLDRFIEADKIQKSL